MNLAHSKYFAIMFFCLAPPLNCSFNQPFCDLPVNHKQPFWLWHSPVKLPTMKRFELFFVLHDTSLVRAKTQRCTKGGGTHRSRQTAGPVLRWQGSFAGAAVPAEQKPACAAQRTWSYLLGSQKPSVLWSDFCGFNGIPLVFDWHTGGCGIASWLLKLIKSFNTLKKNLPNTNLCNSFNIVYFITRIV